MPQFDLPIVQVAIEVLQRDPDNAYVHADGDVQRLTNVITEHEFLVPIVVDVDTLIIVGGEARVDAARAAGYTHIPAVMKKFESPAQRTAVAIALNATYGHFNKERLGEQLRALGTVIDMDLTGLPTPMLERMQQEMQDGPKVTLPSTFRLTVTTHSQEEHDRIFELLQGMGLEVA